MLRLRIRAVLLGRNSGGTSLQIDSPNMIAPKPKFLNLSKFSRNMFWQQLDPSVLRANVRFAGELLKKKEDG